MMTLRMMFKVLLVLLGGVLVVTLVQSGTSFNTHFLHYSAALLLIIGGTVPKHVAYAITGLAVVILLYALTLGGGNMPLPLAWVHLPGMLLAASAFYMLGRPSEVHLWKCPRCFWHGPSTRLRFGHCPRCGYAHLKSEHRSMMTGS